MTMQLIGCTSIKNQKRSIYNISGVYENQSSLKKLELEPNGKYSIWNAENSSDLVFEECEYTSKGKWSVMADNVIELTSEDYYTKQKGFEYEIKEENKFSQDSLYIQVNFPTDFHPVSLHFSFNYDTSKSVTTDKTYIALPKSKYLWTRKNSTNQIGFSLNANVVGTKFYNSRAMFEIFEDSQEVIDTHKFNYLTINLPNFDRCFFEFISYNQDLIYLNHDNNILWQGEIWKKTPNMNR